MMTIQGYTFNEWDDYYRTGYWQRFRKRILIGQRCFCCGTILNLRPHHTHYGNLFHELLYRDIFALCDYCHERVHFYTKWRIRLPIRVPIMLISMIFRKCQICVQDRQIIASALWICILVFYTLAQLYLGFFKLLIWAVEKILILAFT